MEVNIPIIRLSIYNINQGWHKKPTQKSEKKTL